MRQLNGQPINDFLSQLQALWDQLALAEPTWANAKDAEKYFTYRDNLRVLHFLMALTHEFEPVRAAILHRGSLPKLEGVVSELLSEETRLRILNVQPHNTAVDTTTVLAVASNPAKSEKTCNYCRRPGHVISECRKLKYKNSNRSGSQSKGRISNYHPTTGAVTSDSSPTFSLDDIASILKQLVGPSHSTPQVVPDHITSSTLSITPGISHS